MSPETALVIQGPTKNKTVKLQILVDGGPLCVAPVWNWSEGCREDSLFWIYSKKHALHFGPFYASISLAEKGMRKALELERGMWDQPFEWFRHQVWLEKWITENLGKHGDLIGGTWRVDTKEEPHGD